MFSVDNYAQDQWLADDMQGESLVSSVSGRSDLDNFTTGRVGAKKNSNSPSIANGKGPVKTPGVLRTGEAALSRNGQPALPAEKAYAIQIGWRLFRLSGASIMSDGRLTNVEKIMGMK